MRQFKAPQSAQEQCRCLAPELELLYAVLNRAIRDALGLTHPHGNWPTSRPALQRKARDWIGLGYDYRYDGSEWGFTWVCDHLGLDAEGIHASMQRKLDSTTSAKDFIDRIDRLEKEVTRSRWPRYRVDRSRKA